MPRAKLYINYCSSRSVSWRTRLASYWSGSSGLEKSLISEINWIAFGLTVECLILLNRSKFSTGSSPISTIELLLIFYWVYAFLPPIQIKFISRIIIPIWYFFHLSFFFSWPKKKHHEVAAKLKKSRLWILFCSQIII